MGVLQTKIQKNPSHKQHTFSMTIAGDSVRYNSLIISLLSVIKLAAARDNATPFFERRNSEKGSKSSENKKVPLGSGQLVCHF